MPKVLLVAWDGADWKRIHPLLDSGAMPNLARLVENGIIGDVATLTPLCSSLLWTSVGTGQYADRHGVLDFAEADPVTGGVRPVTRASLRAPFIWDILAREGVRCQVTGWPATHPAQGPAICVSDGFVHGAPRGVHPASLAPSIEPLRFSPAEWTGPELHLFVPGLASIDQDQDRRLARLAVILSETVSAQAAATTLMESCESDFSAVWFGAAGAVCELFPPGTEPVYHDAIDGIYRFLDLLLGRLLKLAGSEAIAIVVSDRAAGEPELYLPGGTGSHGMLCAAGAGIEPDELTFGTGLLDIAPTIAAVFGFAVPGLPGSILSGICNEPPVRPVHEPAGAPLLAAAHAFVDGSLRELEKLGYSDTVAAARRTDADAARTRRNFHLARVLIAQDRAAEAIAPLEKITAENPDNVEFKLCLAHAFFRSSRHGECRAVCETLLAAYPDSPLAELARAHLAMGDGNYAEARKHLDAGQAVLGISSALDASMGLAYLRTESWDEAAAAFRSAIVCDPGMAAAHQGLGQALLSNRKYSEAAEAALDAIRLRYDLPDAHGVLASALRAMGRVQAADDALAAANVLRHHRPAA